MKKPRINQRLAARLRQTLPIDHVGLLASDMKNGFIGGERLTSNVALRK